MTSYDLMVLQSKQDTDARIATLEAQLTQLRAERDEARRECEELTNEVCRLVANNRTLRNIVESHNAAN